MRGYDENNGEMEWKGLTHEKEGAMVNPNDEILKEKESKKK